MVSGFSDYLVVQCWIHTTVLFVDSIILDGHRLIIY